MGLPNDAKSQCQRILEHLMNRTGGATTLELVRELDVLRPGARICELRQAGHNIMTHWAEDDTPLGRHRVARYVLLA